MSGSTLSKVWILVLRVTSGRRHLGAPLPEMFIGKKSVFVSFLVALGRCFFILVSHPPPVSSEIFFANGGGYAFRVLQKT